MEKEILVVDNMLNATAEYETANLIVANCKRIYHAELCKLNYGREELIDLINLIKSGVHCDLIFERRVYTDKHSLQKRPAFERVHWYCQRKLLTKKGE